jgi:hypothetical protein
MSGTSTVMSPTSLGRAVTTGAIAGVIGSVVMAMYAMIAAWEKGTGFFTPMYHIASLWASQSAMMTSMKDATAGGDFHFVLGPAVLGAIIHMMTGAIYGAIFGLLVARLRLGLAALTGAGLVYGALVFAVSAFITLPIAAALFNSGEQITNMAQMAGWGTFIVEHLLYGLTVGIVVAISRARTAPGPVAAH